VLAPGVRFACVLAHDLTLRPEIRLAAMGERKPLQE